MTDDATAADEVAALRTAVERLTGERVVRLTVVRGGDTATARRVDLRSGRRLFAKTHADPPAQFFSTEAASLAWLSEADAVAVPDVVAAADEPLPMLLLEWIDEGHPAASTEHDLGVALAGLHGSGAPSFGREDRRTTGSRGLPNEPCTTWAEFYGRRRLLPLAKLAGDGGALAPPTIGRLERLGATLDRFDDGSPPARLHGDLWAGNRIVDGSGRNWLIDPAAHGGHREFDLAMMRLFGGFGDACFASYADVAPLADGWRDRVQLHQIAPLVVHAIKFGGGYVQAATAAIERY